jgi:ATPase subunit of ABC transporter with duplicated ATPase domains
MLKYKWQEPDYQSSTHDISWWEELRLAYSAAEKEKQEALLREKERVAKKQKELAELTKRTNAAIKNKVDSNKAAELEAERKAMEAELADAEESQSNAEEVVARIQAAKREIADSRVEEITKVATKLKYKTQINHLTNKRKTRMKLTW